MATAADLAQDLELADYERNNQRGVNAKIKFTPDEVGYGQEACQSEESGDCTGTVETARRELGYHICSHCANHRYELESHYRRTHKRA